MDSEVAERHHEINQAKPEPGELKRTRLAGRADRIAEPPREIDRESPEKGRRVPRSPESDRDRREAHMAPLMQRLRKVERQYRAMRIGFIVSVIVLGVLLVNRSSIGDVSAGKRLIMSDELKVVDVGGKPRVYLRMFSDVPVMQVLDANGNPRLSLGLRFDDTPFIDFSDSSGITRATFQVTGGGEPAIRMFDGQGESTFRIN